MKRAFVTVFFLFTVSAVFCQQFIIGNVIKITDGDTFTILVDGNKQLKIRFYGIDCPESRQDFGTKARKFTSKLAFAKTVSIQVKDIDRYGRTVGIVTLPNGQVLNEELLTAGLAWHYKQYDNSMRYTLLENQAKTSKLGVWSLKNPIAPWEFRRNR